MKLQLVPMAKPLYMRPISRPMMHLRPVYIGNKPVLSLAPPKLNPSYKPGGYVYKKPLPVNVPPTEPAKPWQHQGWDNFKPEVDKKPFVPSVPVPEPENIPDPNVIHPAIPGSTSSSFPIYPTVNVQPKPVFNVHSFVSSYPLQPAVPIQPIQSVVPLPPPVPAVNLQPVVPLPPPIQPVLPVQPSAPIHPGIHIQPNVHTILHQPKPVLPINVLPGRLNIPVPDLGVLPLGSQLPVHLAAQHSQVLHKPGVLSIGSSVAVPLYPQHPPVVHNRSPVLPVGASVPIFPHLVPQHPQELPRVPVVEPPFLQKMVPQLHEDLFPRPQVYVGGPHTLQKNPFGDGFTPVDSQPERPPIQIAVNQHQQQTNEVPPQQHNYQYFVQQFPQNNIQEQQGVNVQSQHYEHQNQLQEQLASQPGFFQPGKTDLQIPEYLPQHPHFRQAYEYVQENGFDSKKR